MIQLNKPIEIDSDSDNIDNIFAKDLLERKTTIENLSDLVANNKQPLVLSINATWGDGKTTFVKLWQAYLKQKHQIDSIYFSAWEDDFSQDPLIAILGELTAHIVKNSDDKSLETKIKNVTAIGTKLIAQNLSSLVKLATAGIIDPNITDITSSIANELINEHQAKKDILVEFKKSIKGMIKVINPEKPFVIFIDELDRCRPLYAIEFLERIKHVFGIEKLIFVLSLDKQNLAESIKSQYGNIDTNNYLKRFIDLEFSLENPNTEKFCTVLYERFELDKILKNKGVNIGTNYNYYLNPLELMKQLVSIFPITLRQIEQIFTKLHILFSTIESRYLQHFVVFVFFEILKSDNESLYLKLIKGDKETKQKIKNNLSNSLKQSIAQNDPKNRINALSAIIDATAISDSECGAILKAKNKKLLKTGQEIASKIEQDSTEYYEIEAYIRIMEVNRNSMLNNLINSVIQKMNFIDKFDST